MVPTMLWIEIKADGETSRHDLPGTLFGPDGDRYELKYAVRQGGNGVVFSATRYDESGSVTATCAVKVLKEMELSRVDRFNNEVRILKELKHSSIAEYFADGILSLGKWQVPWVAMELGGENLRRHVDTKGPIERGSLVPVVAQMADALDLVHAKQLIHRDIKPENFVWEEGRPDRVLMIDFGIAKRAGEDVSGRPLDNFTKHLEFVGPQFFSSPELIAYARDKKVQVDGRSDLFQLGKVVWFLATGAISAGVPSRSKCPFGGALCELIVATLSDDPRDRPQTASEFRERLEALK